jgi:hypothetical protein
MLLLFCSAAHGLVAVPAPVRWVAARSPLRTAPVHAAAAALTTTLRSVVVTDMDETLIASKVCT